MDFRRIPEMEGYRTQFGPQVSATSAASAPATKRKRLYGLRLIRHVGLIASSVLLAAAIAASAYWWFALRTPTSSNPFTAQVMASVQFPLYYPTSLPIGYKIDSKSVTEPQQGVVVFNLVGPKGEKLYISEEARSSTFDYGGFYKKWDDMREVGVSDGAIAVGHLHNSRTEVASRATNKTWILSNTNAQVPLSQLQTMMKSLTLSY